jgi:aspartate kinase
MISTSEVSVSLSIDATEPLEPLCEELRQFSQVSVEENLSIVCLVGVNIRHTPGIAGRAFERLREKNIRMISQGASRLNLGFVVADTDLVEVVQALHDEFFLTLDPSVFD